MSLAGLAGMMITNYLTAVVASPLPPACAHTKNDYPYIALAIPDFLATGSSYPGDPFALSCVTNESVSGYTPRPGHCVVSIQHNIPTENRVIFYEPHTGATWFMPTGCTVTPEIDCTTAALASLPCIAKQHSRWLRN